ncbi:MAG: hypothetical protein IPH10_11475 [bacterium]|nr:hypothetical protein [bacterium]
MELNSTFLLSTAVLLGVTHTVAGPDHYLPFIALGRAHSWTLRRTLLITLLCGVGHVAASIAIGMAGLYGGQRLLELKIFESLRGDIAAWLLLSFGLAYFVWGLRLAIRSRHVQPRADNRSKVAWILFIIFALGPCEPLIPMLMTPAAALNSGALVLICGTFMGSTVATMLVITALGHRGLAFLKSEVADRYAHALAGGTLSSCAAAMLFLGL